MREKYFSIRFCVMAFQALGFVGLMFIVTLGTQFYSISGMFAGMVGGAIWLALCFGAGDVLRTLVDIERELRGLRDDIHDRFPTPQERIDRVAQRHQS